MKYFRHVLYFCLVTLLATACKHQPIMDNCGFSQFPSAPIDWEINPLNELRVEGNTADLHMISDQIGFLLISAFTTAHVEVLKTIDGGASWTTLMTIDSRRPRDIFFENENIGYFSFGSASSGNLFKTEDGGESWTKIQPAGINGLFNNLQMDVTGHLYGVVYYNGRNSEIVKSEDKGLNWKVLVESNDIVSNESNPGFILQNNKIFIVGKQGDLLITDLNGQYQYTVLAGTEQIQDFKVFDENNILVQFRQQLVKTTTGGQDWKTIHEGESSPLAYVAQNQLLAILNKSCCWDYDVCYSNDALSSLDTESNNWTDGETTQSSLSYLKAVNKVSELSYKLLLGNQIFELKKS